MVTPVGWLLRATDTSKRYGRTLALDHVSVGIAVGEAVAIMGPSGSGKTTLLHILSGILTPDGGRVLIGDQNGRVVEDIAGRITAADGGYRMLALALAGLLVVPLLTLGSAAARLAAHARDDQLATLRLLGLSARGVHTLAITQATIIQSLGVAAGFVVSLGLPFALAGLPVQGRTSDPAALGLPAWASALIVLFMVLVAAVSALLGLRTVVVTPLGVRARTAAPRLGWRRPVIALVVLVGGVILLRSASPSWGMTGIMLALGGVVLAVMGVLNLAGPFVLVVIARRRLRNTSDPATLIAARRNIGDPGAAWREVSAVTLTSFVLVPAGAMLGFLNAVEGSSSALTDAHLMLLADARIMLIALVIISFVVVACQTASTQAAAILDNRDLHIALERIGLSRKVMNRARHRQIGTPVLVAVLGGSLAATTLSCTLVAVAAVTSPAFIAVTAVILAAGGAFVHLGVTATTPVLRAMLSDPQRSE